MTGIGLDHARDPWHNVAFFPKLLDDLNAISDKKHRVIVGIDGPGGCGKSTLAQSLADALGNANLVHMDDFYLPSEMRIDRATSTDDVGGDFDWQRLQRDVLLPLAEGHAARYQRYDWDSDRLAEWHVVEPRGALIIEGVYVLRRELSDLYDVKIWIECDRETRLERGLVRDGVEARDRWVSEWMPEEDRYAALHRPGDVADFVVDGTGG